jgi:hypothetical protein
VIRLAHQLGKDFAGTPRALGEFPVGGLGPRSNGEQRAHGGNYRKREGL